MDIIVITSPEMLPAEAGIINRLFSAGLARLHVRKPDVSEAEVKALIEGIKPEYRNRVSLHQHHQLAEIYGIGGLHFTEKARLQQTTDILRGLKQRGFTLSTSLHDPADLHSISGSFDYAFLGPVFDSISKAGYKSALPAGFRLNRSHFNGKVFALGGIDFNNIRTLHRMGFDGAAMLGSIWQNPEKALEQYRHRAVDRLQFISQETNEMSHIESIHRALEAGCRWVQLRVKDRPEADVLAIAWQATRLCDRFDARLIINDYPRVAQAVDAYGLHLGLSDMPVEKARALVGHQMIIGGTANTWDDIDLRIAEGADYIGLGPFRFTETKKNLSPILGTAGYAQLMRKMTEHGYETPVIAIGGIEPSDIGALRGTGIYGVAMSSSLIRATDPKATVSFIQQSLC